MTSSETEVMTGRAAMALIGALAGLSMWLLIDVIPDVVHNQTLLVTLTAAVCGFFGVLLAISGPVRLGLAMAGAAALGGFASLMLGLASLRFDTVENLLENSFAIPAWGVILFVSTPFVSVMLRDRTGWRDYPKLFDCTWSIIVRYSAAWLFVGVFWLILILSNALLEIVGIDIIDRLIDVDAVPHIFTGLALGLALKVVHEMRDYLSPYMVLHLLRLIIPVMLVVVAVFVGALPMRDPNELFGGLSPAGTLLSVALGMILLISVAMDKDDQDAVSSRWMRLATEGLALLLPVVSGVAVYAIWLRVGQYGWSPSRLAAATAAGFALSYALLYALAVVRRGAWMARLRQSNVWMAFALVVMAVMWLSPIYNAEKISTNSQVGRYLDGRASVSETAIWEMTHEWGKPGMRGVAILRSLTGETHLEMREALSVAASTDRKYVFDRKINDDGRNDDLSQLAALIRPVSGQDPITADQLAGLPDYRIEYWVSACGRSTDHACAIVFEDFDPQSAGREGFIFIPSRGNQFEVVSLRVHDGAFVAGNDLRDRESGGNVLLSADQVQGILDGEYQVAPSSQKSLWLENLELIPDN